MTAVVSRASLSSTVPYTQNTAPVIEFRCLFTHDVRRKSKRWQDGFLRYHTFNKRVMVYDDTRNLIGDTHWKENTSVQEGDEVTLEKGVLVQVAEARGTTETDLTPLFQREKKPLEKGPQGTASRQVSRPTGDRFATPLAPSQLRHKSLNALLGTPRGQRGKAAVSTKSPYEMRHEGTDNEWEDGRGSKRRKVADPPPTWTVVKESDFPKSKTTRATPLWVRTADTSYRRMPQNTRPQKPINNGRGTLNVTELINVASDTENISSDITLPSTPPGITSTMQALHIPAPDKSTKTVAASRLHDAPRTPVAKTRLQARSPPVSTTNKITSVAASDAVTDQNSGVDAQPPIARDQLPPPRISKTKSLRLAVSAPRK
ncbi:hypothetical protein LTS18_013284, partial [Coniosporium uncinatum]